MDRLKDMLTMDPCYEQHIVSIKQVYEDHLLSILVPAMYEGFQSLYKRAYEIEQKFITATKKNPDVENPGILVLFQTLIKQIPSLNTHKIRIETDRIKSSTKSAEVFDDLVRAVCKSNIILLTYNVDHKRKNLLQTKYHENVIVHDFVHSCYVQSARVFYGCPELFYHKQEAIILNQNKRTCYKIIKEAIKDGIRLMLPMKEILLEYVKQKYEQKDKPYVFFANNGYYPGQNPHQHPGANGQQGYFGNPGNAFNQPGYPGFDPSNMMKAPVGVEQEEFMNVNQMIDRDLNRYKNNSEHSLLDDDDDYDPENQTTQDVTEETDETNENSFGEDTSHAKQNDFSLLLSSDSQTDQDNKEGDDTNGSNNKDSLIEDPKGGGSKGDNKGDSGKDSQQKESNDKAEIREASPPEKGAEKPKDNDKSKMSDSDRGLKLIDISGSVSKKGAASTYFNETMPDIKKRVVEYKNEKKKLKEGSKKEDPKKITTKSSPKESHDKTKNDQDAIKITRSNSNTIDSLSTSSESKKKSSKGSGKGDDKKLDNIVNDLLKA